jgi:hypothetical protein
MRQRAYRRRPAVEAAQPPITFDYRPAEEIVTLSDTADMEGPGSINIARGQILYVAGRHVVAVTYDDGAVELMTADPVVPLRAVSP